MTEQLRVGVIGVGYLGRFHALIYSRLPGVDLGRVAALNAARAAEVAPTWAAMFEFEDIDAPAGLTVDAILADAGPISWVARDDTKPGRARGDRWVVHASAARSRELLEEEADEVVQRLLADFRDLIERAGGRAGEPRWSAAHRR